MSAQQQLVGAAGIGLVVVNAWTGPQRQQLAGMFAPKAPDTADAHKAAKQIGAELIGVAVVTLLAGSSGPAGNAAAAIAVALWIVWLARHSTAVGTARSLIAPTGGPGQKAK